MAVVHASGFLNWFVTAGNDKWQALCLIDLSGLHGSCDQGSIYCFPIYL